MEGMNNSACVNQVATLGEISLKFIEVNGTYL